MRGGVSEAGRAQARPKTGDTMLRNKVPVAEARHIL